MIYNDFDSIIFLAVIYWAWMRPTVQVRLPNSNNFYEDKFTVYEDEEGNESTAS